MAEPDARFHYGADPNQFAELWRPRSADLVPAVLLIHGGFWRLPRDLSLNHPLCAALRGEGIAAFNIEYRRVGQPGGGFPGTLEDICAAGRCLATEAARQRLDPARVAVMGHSAGGHLALYLAAEKVLPLRGAVSLAGAVDLRESALLQLGEGAADALLGGSPGQVSERYRQASPAERLPLGVAVRLIHGSDDEVVPLEISRRYEAAARAAGDDVQLISLPGIGHSELIDPTSACWQTTLAALRALLG